MPSRSTPGSGYGSSLLVPVPGSLPGTGTAGRGFSIWRLRTMYAENIPRRPSTELRSGFFPSRKFVQNARLRGLASAKNNGSPGLKLIINDSDELNSSKRI
eukprot:scaffold88_cov40-Attheya_sp.AAC.1